MIMAMMMGHQPTRSTDRDVGWPLARYTHAGLRATKPTRNKLENQGCAAQCTRPPVRDSYMDPYVYPLYELK